MFQIQLVLEANASGSLNALSLGFIYLKTILFDCGGSSFQVCIYLVFIVALALRDLQCPAVSSMQGGERGINLQVL